MMTHQQNQDIFQLYDHQLKSSPVPVEPTIPTTTKRIKRVRRNLKPPALSPDDVVHALNAFKPSAIRFAFEFTDGLHTLLTLSDIPKYFLIDEKDVKSHIKISWVNDSHVLLTAKRILHLKKGLVNPGPVPGKKWTCASR
jgi:hypothetical protein